MTNSIDPIAEFNAWQSEQYKNNPRYEDAGCGQENESD